MKIQVIDRKKFSFGTIIHITTDCGNFTIYKNQISYTLNGKIFSLIINKIDPIVISDEEIRKIVNDTLRQYLNSL